MVFRFWDKTVYVSIYLEAKRIQFWLDKTYFFEGFTPQSKGQMLYILHGILSNSPGLHPASGHPGTNIVTFHGCVLGWSSWTFGRATQCDRCGTVSWAKCELGSNNKKQQGNLSVNFGWVFFDLFSPTQKKGQKISWLESIFYPFSIFLP